MAKKKATKKKKRKLSFLMEEDLHQKLDQVAKLADVKIVEALNVILALSILYKRWGSS